MNIRSNVEIHFYDETRASVLLETNSGEDEKLGEILLFCLFTLRQFVNLGNSEPSRVLAEFLSRVGTNIDAFVCHESPDAARLVRYEGVAGTKRFLGTLISSDDHFDFQMKAKGFGFFARGAGYYAPQSVLILLKHLAQQRAGDCSYVESLSTATRACAEAHHGGQVTVANQAQVAFSIAALATENSDPEPADSDSEQRRTQSSEPRATARPVRASGESMEDIIRRAGSKISAQDFVDTFESVPSTLSFDNLDQATRMVFHRLAQEQADIFRTACPPSALPDAHTLSLEIGKSLFGGYTIGRRLFGTHASSLSFSENEREAQANGQGILRALEHIKPADLLQAAGEHVANFAGVWTEYYSAEGIYTRIADRQGAGTLLFVTMLSGFSLAVAEHEVSQ